MAELKFDGKQIGNVANGMMSVFIAAKLLGYIDWSWWWVLSPMVAAILIVLSATVAILIAAFVLDCAAFMIKRHKHG